MSNVGIDLRLRPVRFVFVVRPTDRKSLKKIFKINTALWGGKYNGIIPFFKRPPSWWCRDEVFRGETATQIINGYLDFFEPDFVVEAEAGMMSNFGFDKDRIVQLDQFLKPDHWDKYGLNVKDVYAKLYKEEFRFESRHKQRVMKVVAGKRKYQDFVACVFGDFDEGPAGARLEAYFNSIFDPITVSFDSDTVAEVVEANDPAPLSIGDAYLDLNFHDHYSPTLFIMDAESPVDLLDYWNLRAIYSEVIAIPVQWIGELSGFCGKYIQDNFRPLPNNNSGVMIHATSLFSRSIPSESIQDILDRLKVDVEGANFYQTRYPKFWVKAPDFMFCASRPTITAGEKRLDRIVETEKPEIRFESIAPDFADRFGGGSRWVNVVRLSDWDRSGGIGTVYPCDYRDPKFPLFGMGRNKVLPTTEGLILILGYKNIPEYWSLMPGRSAISHWLTKKNVSVDPSEAGRATQQIIHTLRGFSGLRAIANPEVVKLLNDTARRLRKAAHAQEFANKIKSAEAFDGRYVDMLEILVNRKVVELGLELQCEKCGSWSWYTLKQVDYLLTCDLCLKTFHFPDVDPIKAKKIKWSYRVIGPFALPDFASGGYSTALAMRLFANSLAMNDVGVTWSSGLNLKFSNGKCSEADFILWYQRKHILKPDDRTEIVFGEAKSFGKECFLDVDVERMKILAEEFPGSVLTFATMKTHSDLSSAEISRLKKLAEWGRVYDKSINRTRAPVIVLTGTELFSLYDIQGTWEKLGGLHQKLIQPAWIEITKLRVLADLTQQIYLGMDSYDSWSRKKRGGY